MKEKRGLWQDENPIPPWEFRKKERKHEKQRGKSAIMTQKEERSCVEAVRIILEGI